MKFIIKWVLHTLDRDGWKVLVVRSIYLLACKMGAMSLLLPKRASKLNNNFSCQWKQMGKTFFDFSYVPVFTESITTLDEKIGKYRQEQYLYFQKSWYSSSTWHIDPVTQKDWNMSLHWSKISDFTTTGDIKFIWEKARFGCVYDFIRYQHYTRKSTSEDVISRIESWINDNPVHIGPHWKCSQEISIRVLNWTFALHYYQHDPSWTEIRLERILQSINEQMEYVWRKRWYARTLVSNNHVLTEALVLYVIGLSFPFFAKSSQWVQDGHATFEREIKRQIFDDGTYLQYSMIYHRLVVQLLTWFIQISNFHLREIDPQVIVKAKKSIDFLTCCMDEKTGQLPNYGHNDGSLLFPLSNCDYLDFRPSLQALQSLVSDQYLFMQKAHLEEMAWIGKPSNLATNKSVYKLEDGLYDFPSSGYIVIRESASRTFLRYGSYQHRPAHADHLHVDLWYNGYPLLQDSGTFQYATTTELKSYFRGTRAHNTVILNDENQMEEGPRFLWYQWIEDASVTYSESSTHYYVKASFEGFKQISKGIRHTREIHQCKGKPEWKIVDNIENAPQGTCYYLIWHPSPAFLDSYVLCVYDERYEEIKPIEKKGFTSQYYAECQEQIYWEFRSFSPRFTTTIRLC